LRRKGGQQTEEKINIKQRIRDFKGEEGEYSRGGATPV